MGRSFEMLEGLADRGISKEAANEAGQNFARTLAGHGARYAVDQDTIRKLLMSVLGKDLSAEEKKLVDDLARRSMEVASGLGSQNVGQWMYKLGEGIGGVLKGGVTNGLSSGFYGLVFDDSHEFHFSVESFYAGLAMGAIGGAGHLMVEPLRVKFQSLSDGWDEKSKEYGADRYSPKYLGEYYGPFHPRVLLAVAANLTGHPTSLLIPRPVRVEGGELDSALTSGNVRTMSDGPESRLDRSLEESEADVSGANTKLVSSASGRSVQTVSTENNPTKSPTGNGTVIREGDRCRHRASGRRSPRCTSRGTSRTRCRPRRTRAGPPGAPAVFRRAAGRRWSRWSPRSPHTGRRTPSRR
jgi:hypothetical protein